MLRDDGECGIIACMLERAESLPEDPVRLRQIIAQLHDQLGELEHEREAQDTRIQQLLETIELLRRKRFGPSADRVPDNQLALFDEAELEALIDELEGQLPSTDETPSAPSTGTRTRCC